MFSIRDLVPKCAVDTCGNAIVQGRITKYCTVHRYIEDRVYFKGLRVKQRTAEFEEGRVTRRLQVDEAATPNIIASRRRTRELMERIDALNAALEEVDQEFLSMISGPPQRRARLDTTDAPPSRCASASASSRASTSRDASSGGSGSEDRSTSGNEDWSDPDLVDDGSEDSSDNGDSDHRPFIRPSPRRPYARTVVDLPSSSSTSSLSNANLQSSRVPITTKSPIVSVKIEPDLYRVAAQRDRVRHQNLVNNVDSSNLDGVAELMRDITVID